VNFSEIKEIIAQIDQSTIKEIQLKQGEFELLLSKNDQVARESVAAAPVENIIQEVVETPQSSIGVQDVPKEIEGELVTSPLVGVVYLQPAPDKARFVEVGATVKKGDTLCIVEAMKVMNEIPADKSGVITEILVDSEAVVEFGQPLFRIK
jgi:acetyl-CoA carboxylase biotin carboxyl carrier protein